MKSFQIGSLNASFRDIELDFGLKIQSFEITSNTARASIDPFELNLDSPGNLKAIVTEQAVADFLEAKAPSNISGFQVSISGGKIHVNATANIVLSLPVKAVCTLEIVSGQQVFVRLESVDVMGGKAKSIVENQLDKVNPILDVSELPLNVVLNNVEADAGIVTLTGQVVS